MKVMFKDRLVKNFEVEDVHSWDYPDFCDAYISYAEWEDGTPLTDEELEEFYEANRDVVYELAYKSYHS